MAVYFTGKPRGSRYEHKHSGWVEPINLSGKQVWAVPERHYVPGELSVRISAEDEGEEGATLVFPPAYAETDPGEGIFTLTQALPDGWKIWVKYTFQ